MQFLSKIPAGYFINVDKLIVKFIWKWKECVRTLFKKKSKVERIILPDFKTDL